MDNYQERLIQNASNTNKYKHFISSTAALLLTTNLANAAAAAATQNIDKCWEKNTCPPITKGLGFYWNGGGDTVNFDKAKNHITFGTGKASITIEDSKFQNGSSSVQPFNFPNQTMSINFPNWGSSVTFSITTAQDFNGHLRLVGGNGNSTFNGTFSKDLNGNVLVINSGGYRAPKANLTFKEKGAINGSVLNNMGKETKITFEKEGTITKGVTARSDYGGGAYEPFTTIVFKEKGTIGGGLITYVGENKVEFAKGGTITGNLESRWYNWTNRHNRIKVGEGSLTINGSLIGGAGHNTIEEGSFQPIVPPPPTGPAKPVHITINGNVTSNEGGVNTIKLQAPSSSLTIHGSVTTDEGSNILEVAQGTLTIKGREIRVQRGEKRQNTIKAKNLDIEVESIESKPDWRYISTNTTTIESTESATLKARNITSFYATNNIKLKGTQSGTSSRFTGNLTAKYKGVNNTILEDTSWKPYSTDGSSGTLTTQPEGKNQLVMRHSSASTTTPAPNYRINTYGGVATFVEQGPIKTSAEILYTTQGTTTLIFAKNSNGTDGFTASDTSIGQNKVLGKTYQDGIKLTLKDKNISVGNFSGLSFINTFGGYFRDSTSSALLKLTADNTTTTSNHHKITLQGLAVGDITALAPSSTTSSPATPATYDITIATGGAFVGGINPNSNGSDTIKLTMQQGAKLMLNSPNLTLQSLTISGSGGTNGAKFHGEQILHNSFSQGNTIIDISSDGNEFGGVPTRSSFRLLTIGAKAASGGAAGGGGSSGGSGGSSSPQPNADGLKGSNALFRIYVNNSSEGTLGTTTKQNNNPYGKAYSDRILVHAGTKSTQYAQVLFDGHVQASNIKYHGGGSETDGNIAVFTTKNDGSSSTPLVDLKPADSVVGFERVGALFTPVKTDEYGKVNSNGQNQDYTTYFLSAYNAKGITLANKSTTSSAFNTNYALYLANMNSSPKEWANLEKTLIPMAHGLECLMVCKALTLVML